jgi:tellurite resistance protein
MGTSRTVSRQRRPGSRKRPGGALQLDEALIALFIGAMTANDHVAADEAERAHHLIWSTRRFRRKSGDAVGKLIQDVRARLEQHDADAVIAAAARTIPRQLRPSAFAMLADLLLADGRMDAKERRFLHRIGSTLAIEPEAVRQMLDVLLLKNRL